MCIITSFKVLSSDSVYNLVDSFHVCAHNIFLIIIFHFCLDSDNSAFPLNLKTKAAKCLHIILQKTKGKTNFNIGSLEFNGTKYYEEIIRFN